MKSFRADYLFTVCADPIKNGIITVDDSGKIIAVTDPRTLSDYKPDKVEKLSGIICPGFINTHCHVELSHLKDKIKPHTGLIEFIKQIQSIRTASPQEINDAASKADQEMFDNGIVAVGDICNSNATLELKKKSKIYYHNFIETFSFLPDRAEEVFNKALALLDEFKPHPRSIVPHAPYSVSKELFKLIRQRCDHEVNLMSMHNQECEEENKFYRYKLGEFLDLYEHFGINIDFFKPQARNSIQSVIPLLTNKQNILLVHNTSTNLKDIYFIKRFDRKIHWAFCPGANLYIENRLPKVELFLNQGFNITLGTDSLASNTGLSILHEMILIQENFPIIDTATLIEWATINGAKFLGVDDEKGTLEVGKSPGLNLITGVNGLKLTSESKVRRLV